jgi:phosphatidylserine decarboxylase
MMQCRLFAALLAAFLVLASAESRADDYESAVPESLRTLITRPIFDQALSDLQPLVEGGHLKGYAAHAIAGSPCSPSLGGLVRAVYGDTGRYQPIFDAVNTGFVDPPAYYGTVNPWRVEAGGDAYARMVTDIVMNFVGWCTFLPQIDGDQDNGLQYILDFAWFYYRNPAGQMFVQGMDPLTGESDPMFRNFLEDFSIQRGAFMDTPESTFYVAQWLNDPRIEIEDYQKQQVSDYDSWNAFFAREITVDEENETIPSRPTTMPERDYVVSAPTDCIMNPLVQVLDVGGEIGQVRALIDNPLAANTIIDVKSYPISLYQLLGSAPLDLKEKFVGGSGVACVLMPNTYHHFHTPVTGEVVHAEVIEIDDAGALGTFGYFDWPNWVPDSGNVGQPGTDFSQFEVFQRGVVIIRISYAGAKPGEVIEGYVASIPVGLDTIGSVVLDEDIVPGAQVKRGYTRLGNFYYGGSLNILLFSKGIASSAIQVRLGNQIGILNAGETPE